MIFAYADHNFIINSAKNPAWLKSIIAAKVAGKATLVLSPFHFDEFGNVKSEEDRDELLAFAEKIQPAWILERLDIQLREFLKEWMEIWTGQPFSSFEAIGSLADATAALFRTHPRHFEKYAFRDFVAEFTRERLEGVLLPVMKDQERIAAANSIDFKAGRLTPSMKKLVDRAYVAQQLALANGLIVPVEVQQRARAILREQPIATMVEWFVEWGCVSFLKTYQVEGAFTEDFYSGDKRLNKNRFVDRQHAIGALTHCDVLVTDDGELIKHCEKARARLKFPIAVVETGQEFIARVDLLVAGNSQREIHADVHAS